MWTVFSVLFLIAGIALLGWHHARHKDEQPLELPKSDPLALVRVTPSMKATAKYFWLVIALFLTQILLGAITAHYQVEGQLPAVFTEPHLAHTARGVVDRDRVARHGFVHRAGDIRP
jgi:nitric oxide reductase large subunit